MTPQRLKAVVRGEVQGVVFHDGDAVTAEAVCANYDRSPEHW